MLSEMKPGPELDALVAEKVMGHRVCFENHAQSGGWCMTCNPPKYVTLLGVRGVPFPRCEVMKYGYIPRYSTEIEDAWKVVELLKRLGCHWWMSDCGKDSRYQYTTHVRFDFDNRTFADGYSRESISHAICLAALKSKGVEV